MTKQAISPLGQRMIDDMAIRKFAPKTKDLAVFLGRSPDTAKAEDVRSFRLHLSSIRASRRIRRATT